MLDEDGDNLWFYRHSDGYPEGALPTLNQFMRWVIEGKIRSNVEQASGWLVLIGAKEYAEYGNKADLTVPSGDWKAGAYEPCLPRRHGDIAYLYVLDLINLTIRVEDVYDHKTAVLKKKDIIADVTKPKRWRTGSVPYGAPDYMNEDLHGEGGLTNALDHLGLSK